jgi:hypothetical protein
LEAAELPDDVDLEPVPVGRGKIKRMAMHGKRGQGERRPHGEPCHDEQRSPAFRARLQRLLSTGIRS